jgi:hypothetical protein
MLLREHFFRLVLLAILLAATMPATVAHGQPPLQSRPAQETPATPFEAKVIAAYYGRTVAEVEVVHQQGMDYWLLFQLFGFVKQGKFTMQELRTWNTNANNWAKLNKLTAKEWASVGTLDVAIKAYCQVPANATDCKAKVTPPAQGQKGQQYWYSWGTPGSSGQNNQGNWQGQHHWQGLSPTPTAGSTAKSK